MDSLERLRAAIATVFAAWGKLPRIGNDWRVAVVMDRERDEYVLLDVDQTGDKLHSRPLAHLEIRDGKIWIVTDNTEEGIATELLREGVEKREIVLGFYPPSVREMGEFAVA